MSADMSIINFDSMIADAWYLYPGLSVVYLSGRQSASDMQFGTYSEDDVDALRALAEEPEIVDIFLTYPLCCLI